MTRSRYRIYDNAYPHFLTCTIVDWLPIFTRPEATQILLDSWSFLQQNKRLTLFAYVILENHVHFIASSNDWRYSSARNFAGLPGLIDVTTRW